MGLTGVSVLPFLALWLVRFFALHDRGMARAPLVLASVVIALPAFVVYEVLLRFLALATSR
jgi:hypothetical protein